MDLNLEKYCINFGNHIVDVASEGFLFSDKTPHTEVRPASQSGVWDSVNYKKKAFTVPGTNWAEVFAESHTKVIDGFLKNGLNKFEKYIQEIEAGDRFVKSHGEAFRQAVTDNNVEVLRNLSEGLRKCLPSVIESCRMANKGMTEFSGEAVETTPEFKRKFLSLLTKFQITYRKYGILTANKYVEEYESKSTIRKLSKKTGGTYAKRWYLENELYAYCKDVHVLIQRAFV